MKRPSAISGYEMVAIQMVYFGASAGFIYPSLLIRSTGDAYWVPVAVWAAAALLSSWLYSRMLARLEGGKLIAGLCSSIGKVWSFLLILPILLFLGGAMIVLLRAFSEVITMTMLPTTPISFLNGMLLAPAALALAGMMPIVRSARVFFLVTILCSSALLLIGLSNINWTLGSPWLRTSGDFLGNKRFYAGSFLWMGFVLTAFIGPYTAKSAKRSWKSYALALCCALPFIACYIYLPVLTFGKDLSRHLTFPFVSKMDAIYHYWIVFENMTAMFVSVTMLYVLLILALKMHALGESFQLMMPRVNAALIYGVLLVAVYWGATAISSWRVVEDLMIVTVGLRLYVLFVFPLLGMAVLILAGKRREKERAL
ncbi:GerAB/ArcD/ProY family transporter [Paenibacillus lycopersici]|uniref:GerAB/ArcD/ProY family transporter n=1 Tax=Paenibacillus lycopersici TaxID=2704462 RepID=A0A6C0FV85_9BACL|nr:GerAB/ArcD/ProY family transporter [Paenibacillus lycopersici]QHT61048.1 GerAB/ArcD/ProY family transporter [Paenibacillus lycopersici]